MKTLDIILDEQEFAFMTGFVFRGLTITESPEGYNIIIRAYSKAGEAVYCMTVATDPETGLYSLWLALTGKEGYKLWRTDKYAR